jgi:hypothetical protein
MWTNTTHSDWKLDVTHGAAESSRILEISSWARSVLDSIAVVLI